MLHAPKSLGVSLLPAALAFLLWALTCIRWFDAGAAFRPPWLAALPPALLALTTLGALVAWLRRRSSALLGPGAEPSGALLLVLALTFFFRLPMAWWGAAGHLTSDGSLSGILAVHIRDGIEHPVFVPSTGYSGSLKAHLTVLLGLLMDMPRAFALASVLFYVLFAAAVYRLGALADEGGRVGLYAGLYAAFAPAWVTHYSLSNDGNYIEALAFGAWALFFAARWIIEKEHRTTRAAVIGLLLGLGFWCHLLVVLHAVTVVLVLLAFGRRDALRSLPLLALGFVAGDLPGLLWNAENDWFSFGYLSTGAHQDRPVDVMAFSARILPMVTDHWPILLGYDAGLPPPLARVSFVLAWGAVVAALVAVAVALAAARRQPAGVLTVLLVFAATNVGLALTGAEHIAGNPRYLLFLMTPIAVFLAVAFGGRWRPILAVILAFGALGSLATFPPNVEADARWRGFVAALQREGVRWCHTDYYLAAKINFLSEEKVLCSSRLGPTKADYFRYADRVDPAPAADLIPINRTRADRIGLRLQALGVRYERLDLMKPVLLRLSRKVDPDELPPLPQLPAASTLR
jgi:hypothetical protein